MATAHLISDIAVPPVRAGAGSAGKQLLVSRIGIQAILVIALLLSNNFGVTGNVLFFAALVLMAIKTPELAFKALTIGFLGLVANQAIVPKTPFWTVARFLLPMVCLIRFSNDLATLRASLFTKRYFIALTAFVAVAAVLSIASQYFVEIALLKLFNFAIATTAMLAGAEVLRLRKSDLAEWYVTTCVVTVVLGFASLALGFGYNMRGTGVLISTFNGPFYHSNCLGPMAAMMVVYLACLMLFGRYRNRWLCLALAGCLVFFMALTQSRTSFASLFVGLVTILASSFVLVRRRMIRLRMSMSRVALSGVIALIAVGLIGADAASGGALTRATVAFANKGGKSDQLDITQVLSSRQSVIDASWGNFLQSPLIGIGFEVAKTEFFRQNASLFYAPIEKGFLPVAVLEETGIIGTAFFVVFLLAYLGYLTRRLNIPGVALTVTFLAVNCGEAMFFAVAGHGALGWLWFIGGMMLGDVCVELLPRPVRVSAAGGRFQVTGQSEHPR